MLERAVEIFAVIHFLIVGLSLGFTGKRTFDFASDFSSTFTDANGVELTQAGTLVGSSTWKAISQGIGFRIGKAF
ncbi:MAG TPA: hypothetical protein VNQ76_10865 [Planctomicrobium sp.]|nr:hypothetical protein [Planctomicrobium sp.]